MKQQIKYLNNPKKQMTTSFIILIFLSLFLVVFPLPVHASILSLGVYPPIIQIDAVSPADVKSPITVSNLSDVPVKVTIVVRPFTASSSDNGQIFYIDPKTRFGEDPDIFQKMAIFDGEKNTDQIELAPNQKRNIELRIHLPKDEPPSDYYFSITFLSNSINTDGTTGSSVAGGISTNVLLSIGPKDKTTGFIKEFSAPIFVDHGPVPFTIHVTNTSKHFINPQGTILIKNMFGQTIGKVDLLPVNILANTSRFLPSAVISDTQAMWGEKFLLGPYTANLTLALSTEGPVYRRTIYFFALPLQVLIGLGIAFIIIIIVVYRVKKQLENQ